MAKSKNVTNPKLPVRRQIHVRKKIRRLHRPFSAKIKKKKRKKFTNTPVIPFPMSSPQFVFKFPNFIRQFSSGTVYTDPLPFSPPVYHIPEGVSVPKLFYNPFQPVAKSVVFQRKSTVKKKKKKKPIGVLFETRSTLSGSSPPPRFLSPHPLFLLTVSRHRDAGRRGAEGRAY